MIKTGKQHKNERFEPKNNGSHVKKHVQRGVAQEHTIHFQTIRKPIRILRYYYY